MRRSVARLRLKAEKSADFFSPDKKIMDKIFANLPGVGFLDFKTRLAYAWEPGNNPGKRRYVISYQYREITGPDERKATFDRAPFQLFLALFQKHGHLLLRHEGVAIVERVTREFLGPIMLQQWDPPSCDRNDTFVLYPEMNRIVAKLKRQLEKIGLGYTLKTVRGQGWQFNTSGIDFAFKDMPVCLPDSGEPAFLSIDIDKKEVRYLDKTCHLGPLPFKLLQLLMRYSGVPINTRLINLELGIIAEDPLSEQGYRSVQNRVRQYFKCIRQVLSAIEAPFCIVSEYGIGWRLSVLK